MNLRGCFKWLYAHVMLSIQPIPKFNRHCLLNLRMMSNLKIQQAVSVKLDESLNLSPEILLSKLSYSQFIELIRIDDPLERLFYEVEAIKNNCGVQGNWEQASILKQANDE